jgi:hypothetical protein
MAAPANAPSKSSPIISSMSMTRQPGDGGGKQERSGQTGLRLVGPLNGALSFVVATRTAINDLVKQGGQHYRLNRFDLHRRITAPTAYVHGKIIRFLTFAQK